MVDSQNPYFTGNRPQLAVAQYDVSGVVFGLRCTSDGAINLNDKFFCTFSARHTGQLSWPTIGKFIISSRPDQTMDATRTQFVQRCSNINAIQICQQLCKRLNTNWRRQYRRHPKIRLYAQDSSLAFVLRPSCFKPLLPIYSLHGAESFLSS